jgi:excisionase family DNA binding protein
MRQLSTNDTLMTRAQAAEFLGLREQTLAKWASDRRHLAFVKIGRNVRYRQRDLEQFLLDNVCRPGTGSG